MLVNRGLVIQVLFLLALVVASSIILPRLPLQNPLQIDLTNAFAAPSAVHLFGTDQLGRDVFARVIHGFSTTVVISVVAMVISLSMAVLLGAAAGFRALSWYDIAFNWVVALIFSLPFLLVMASVTALSSPGLVSAYTVLACIMWAAPARIARAEARRICQAPFIIAARSMGFSEGKIFLGTVLPFCMKSSFIFLFGYLPEIVGLEVGLSFLGLGVQPPEPALGYMIFAGLDHIHSGWWMTVFPAGSLCLLVLMVNLIIWKSGMRFRQ